MSNDTTQQQKTYRTFFMVASISFTAATIASFSISSLLLPIFLYKITLQFYSLLMIYVEYLNLQASQKHKWSNHVFVVNSIGYFLYFLSAVYYERYNQGILYVAAAFIVILATEFNLVVMLIYSEKTVQSIIKDDKNIFMKYMLQGVSHSLFLVSTLMLNGEHSMFYPSILNLFSGLIIQGSVYYLYTAINYNGYRQFESIQSLHKMTQ